MQDFPIKVNDTNIMFSEIDKFLRRSRKNEAIDFIIQKSNCTKEEAISVVDDVNHMRQLERESKLSNQVIHKTTENINVHKEKLSNDPDLVHCPKCNSTQITTGARGVNSFWGLIGASSTVNRCARCGHTWKPKYKG